MASPFTNFEAPSRELARHGIKGKACADFRHTARTLGDDHEIDDHEHAKDNKTDKQVAAHDEHGEAFDDPARSMGACMSLADDQLGR